MLYSVPTPFTDTHDHFPGNFQPAGCWSCTIKAGKAQKQTMGKVDNKAMDEKLCV